MSKGAPKDRPTVLVVDDDPLVLNFIRCLLKRGGFAVDTAESVDAAISILQQRQDIDIVLSDLLMPEKTGEDLHKWLLSHRKDLAETMIAITGYPDHMTEFASQLRREGRFIEKPLKPITILETTINRVLAQKSADQKQDCKIAETQENPKVIPGEPLPGWTTKSDPESD